MINNLGAPSSKVQINFGVLQIDTENSALGLIFLCHQDQIFKEKYEDKRELYTTKVLNKFLKQIINKLRKIIFFL